MIIENLPPGTRVTVRDEDGHTAKRRRRVLLGMAALAALGFVLSARAGGPPKGRHAQR